jgi:hypothetical protein
MRGMVASGHSEGEDLERLELARKKAEPRVPTPSST